MLLAISGDRTIVTSLCRRQPALLSEASIERRIDFGGEHSVCSARIRPRERLGIAAVANESFAPRARRISRNSETLRAGIFRRDDSGPFIHPCASRSARSASATLSRPFCSVSRR